MIRTIVVLTLSLVIFIAVFLPTAETKKDLSRQRQKSKELRNITDLLDTLLLGYDNHLRPDFGGPPTEVLIDLHVRSMGPIAEIDMSYSMDCYFRQSWKDFRLAYDPEMYLGKPKNLALSVSMLDKIWKPDTYFYNGKKAYIHTITNPNKFVRIASDGMVLYSSRMTVKASCPMRLERFPMDTQRCPLEVGSFGYSIRDVIYRWNPKRTVVIAPDMKMSQFDLTSSPAGNLTGEFKRGGPFSRLVVSFHFKRLMGSFIIEVYAPGILLVILSWVSFWINREATADRISLGIMTILTMTFLGLETRNDLPKVSYMTALDYFVTINFAMIFSTIVQFAIVHYYTKIGSGEYYIPPPEILKKIEACRAAAINEGENTTDGEYEEYTTDDDAKGEDQEQLQPIQGGGFTSSEEQTDISQEVRTKSRASSRMNQRQTSSTETTGDQEVPRVESAGNNERNKNSSTIKANGKLIGFPGSRGIVPSGATSIGRSSSSGEQRQFYPQLFLMNALDSTATMTSPPSVLTGHLGGLLSTSSSSALGSQQSHHLPAVSVGSSFHQMRQKQQQTTSATTPTSISHPSGYLSDGFSPYAVEGGGGGAGQQSVVVSLQQGQQQQSSTKSPKQKAHLQLPTLDSSLLSGILGGDADGVGEGFVRDFCPIHGEIVKSRSSTKVSGSKTPTTSQGVYPFTAISISQSIADQQAPKRDAFGNTGAGILSSQILDQDIAPVLRNRAQVSSGQTIVPQEGTSASSAATGGLNRFSNLRNSFSNYYSSGRRRKKLSASARVRQSRRKEGEAIPFQLNSVSQIDKFSRVFFPVTFMVINYIYWSYYLKDEEYVSNVWNG